MDSSTLISNTFAAALDFSTPVGLSPVHQRRHHNNGGDRDSSPINSSAGIILQQQQLHEVAEAHFYAAQRAAMQQKRVENVFGRSSPVRREHAEATSLLFGKTLADIDRRTRRSDSYIVKKIEVSERRHEMNRHRVARDIPSPGATAGSSATAAMYSQLRNGGTSHHVAGMRIKMIQEDIARRHAQSEDELIRQGVPSRNTKRRAAPPTAASATEQQLQIELPLATASHHHHYTSGDSDMVDKSNAVRRRLDDARRSTQVAVRTLFDAAVESFERREVQERVQLSTDETQQFARLTAFKAMSYVAASSPERSRSATQTSLSSELEKFLVLSGYKEREEEGILVNNTAASNNSNNTDGNNNNNNNNYYLSVASTPSTVAKATRATKAVAPHAAREKDDATTKTIANNSNNANDDVIKALLATESICRDEAEKRQHISDGAFDSFMPLAFQAPKPRRNADSAATPATNNNRSRSSSSSTNMKQPLTPGKEARLREDSLALSQMFVLENLVRREAQTRQDLLNDAFSDIVSVMAHMPRRSLSATATATAAGTHNTNNTSKSKPASGTASAARLNALYAQDNKVLKELYLVESLEKRESQARQGIAIEGLSAALALALHAPNNARARAATAPTADAASSIHSVIVVETLLLRESEQRNAAELEAWREYLRLHSYNDHAVMEAVAMSNFLSASAAASAYYSSQPNEGASAAKGTTSESATLRQLFILEQTMRRESERRSKISIEAMDFAFASAGWRMPATAAMYGAASTSSARSIVNNSGRTSARSKSASAGNKAAEDQATLRALFVIETLLRREQQRRADIAEEAFSARMQIATDFALQRAFRATSSRLTSPPRSGSAAAAAAAADAQRNQQVLREMFLTENVFHREADTRASLQREAMDGLLEMLLRYFMQRNNKSSSSNQIGVTKGTTAKAGADQSALREAFLVMTLMRLEQQRRCDLYEQDFSTRMQMAAVFATQIAATSSAPSPSRSASVPRCSSAAAAQSNQQTLREMFVTEHLFHREADSRARLQGEATDSQLELLRILLQQLGALSPAQSTNASSNNNNSNNNDNPSNRSSSSADTSIQKSAGGQAVLRESFLVATVLRGEQQRRADISAEEALESFHLALNWRPLPQVHRQVRRMKKDLASLREVYLGEYAMRRALEQRSVLQNNAAEEKALLIAGQWQKGLLERFHNKAANTATTTNGLNYEEI